MTKEQANRIIHAHKRLMNQCGCEKTEPFAICWVEVKKCTTCGKHPISTPDYTGDANEALRVLEAANLRISQVYLTSSSSWGWQACPKKAKGSACDVSFCLAICTAALRSIRITEGIDA